jgi:tetratricopeptide (TPR) repeat protein
MWRASFILTVGISLAHSQTGQTQTFKPRGQSTGQAASQTAANSQGPSTDSSGLSNRSANQTSTISGDLLGAYEQTKRAVTELELTAIARTTAKAVADNHRSQADRDYARSLLAWALNRRGELRSEQAAALADSGQTDRASKLDTQAADDFATAVEYSPANWRHRHNFAVALAMKGQYKQAVTELTQAIKLNPQYANAHFNRAELYLELNDLRAAEQDYSRAIELAGEAQYFNGRAHCRFLMEKYAEAITDYRQAAEGEPSNAAFQTDLADAYQFNGQWEQAAQAYRQAVAADNTYSKAYQNAAWLMATCPDSRYRNHELATSAAKKAIELTGRATPETVETLAAATAANGQQAQAIKMQEEAIRLAKSQKATAEQIAELTGRLEVYQAGRAYQQPQPEASTARTAGNTNSRQQ